jgi:hypothetical protein
MPKGRRPIRERSMTAPQRQRKRRAAIKDKMPPPGSEKRFRLELLWWLQDQAWKYGSLDINLVKDALQELGTNIKMEDYSYSKGYKHDGGRWLADFITQNYGYERVVDLAGRGLEILRLIEDYTPAEIEQSRQRAEEEEKAKQTARHKLSSEQAGTVVEQLRRAVADAFSASRDSS